MTTPVKPKRGKPATEADRLAVIQMENEVVERHAVRGHSFYRIERDLGITSADRIYRRAMRVRPLVVREEAYQVQRARLDALHVKTWEALERDGLESLADKVADLVIGHYDDIDAGYEHDTSERVLSDRIRETIERAYADTYKAIPVALGVHDRAVKLDGLDHAARIADAQLQIDGARVALMGAALAEALDVLADVAAEDKARVVVRWGELASGLADPEEDLDLGTS